MADQRTPEPNSWPSPTGPGSNAANKSAQDPVAQGKLETLRRAQETLRRDSAKTPKAPAKPDPVATIPGEDDVVIEARRETMRRARTALEIDLREDIDLRDGIDTHKRQRDLKAVARPGLPQRSPTQPSAPIQGVPLNVNLDTRVHTEPRDPVAITHLKPAYLPAATTSPAQSRSTAKWALAALALGGTIAAGAWWFTRPDPSTPITTGTNQAIGIDDTEAEQTENNGAIEATASQESFAEETADEEQSPSTEAPSDADNTPEESEPSMEPAASEFRLVYADGEASIFGAPDPAAFAELRLISNTVLADRDPTDRTSNRNSRPPLDAEAATGLAALREAGDVLTIELTDPILTDAGQVSSSANEAATRLADYLQAEPDLKLLIAGHTDNLGPEGENRLISLRQAQQFNELLLNAGADRTRLATRGSGESSPIADNGRPDGRALNSRVEISFIWA